MLLATMACRHAVYFFKTENAGSVDGITLGRMGIFMQKILIEKKLLTTPNKLKLSVVERSWGLLDLRNLYFKTS